MEPRRHSHLNKVDTLTRVKVLSSVSQQIYPRACAMSTQPVRYYIYRYSTVHKIRKSRAISSARLKASLPVHLHPIDVLVLDDPQGDLILRPASCLDAFSIYPITTWIPGGAAGATTGKPEVGPARSSRTSASSTQVSCAHDR